MLIPLLRGHKTVNVVQDQPVSIRLTCTCGKKLKAPDELAGKRAKCPACGSLLAVPGNVPDAPAGPREDDPFDGQFPSEPAQPSPEAKLHLPLIEEAVRSLESRIAVSPQGYSELQPDETLRAFTIPGIHDQEGVEKIKKALDQTVAEGGSLQVFARKAKEAFDGVLPLSPPELEFIYRNNARAALAAGRDKLLDNPVLRDVFPYAKVLPIHDSRLSSEHYEFARSGIQGTAIFRRDDPTWKKYQPPWGLNCRCGSVVLTIPEAARQGIREAQQWHETGVPPAEPTWVKPLVFDPQTTPCELLGVKAEIPYLLEQLRREDDIEGTIECLGNIGPDAKDVVPVLIDAMKTDDEGVRLAAARAICRIDENADPALVAPFIEALSQDYEDGSYSVKKLLRDFGPQATLSVLTGLLKSGGSERRRAAAHALGQMGPIAASAIPQMIEVLRDEDPHVRSAVAFALRRMGSAATVAVPMLVEILRGDLSRARGVAGDIIDAGYAGYY